MRLYLSGESANKFGYTPDTLIVEGNGKRYEYDIFGETDYDFEHLHTRTKGELKLLNPETDEYETLEKEQEEELVDMLANPNMKAYISIYPVPSSENSDKLEQDILSHCEGLLEFGNDLEVRFDFETEFYGL